MLRNLLATLGASLFIMTSAWSQAGQSGIKGKVLDTDSGEPLPFVNVVVLRNGVQVTGASTDFDGNYFIKPLDPGTYSVSATFTGYKPVQINGVRVNANQLAFLDVKMASSVTELDIVEIVEYKVPLISKDKTTSGGTVTSEDLLRMPGRSASAIASTVGGVFSQDDGGSGLNIRGSRSDANYYFIDGIKVRGSSNLPQSAIEEVQVMTGGVPAQYGDVTGGVISITTKGPSSVYFGGVEFATSGFATDDGAAGLDRFGYNLAEFSLAGPLVMKKDDEGKPTEPLLGFFISGNYTSNVDSRGGVVGSWQATDATMDNISENPLRFFTGGTGTVQNAEYLRLNDFEKVRTRPNVSNRTVNFTGKIDVNTGKTTNLTIGGQFNNNLSNNYLFNNSVYNSHHNPESSNTLWRAYARFTQRFLNAEDTEESSSVIKNAYYTVQVDYSQTRYQIGDKEHADDLFRYGYYGEFKRFQERDYSFGPVFDSIYDGTKHGFSQDTVAFEGIFQQTFTDTLIGFTPSDMNYHAAQYTQNYYELFGWEGYDENGNPVFDSEAASVDLNGDNIISGQERNYYLRQFANIQGNGGLVNGDQPNSIYNLWDSPATVYNSFQRNETNQFRLSLMGSADIKNHAITVGFEYEQRVDRAYSASPRGLWTIGQQYTNNHIEGLDKGNSTIDYSNTYPTVSFERLNASPGEFEGQLGGDPQYFFDYNLRQSLGLDPDGTDFIDFHSLSPEDLSIDYFSADELLNNGNQYVSYFGYDAYGNKLDEAPSFDDFFTETNENGNYNRYVDAFRPIYVAGFIQDKFAFDDLVFNVGLRVDRYDANQNVLKDPYVLFPTYSVGEFENTELGSDLGDSYNVPGNMEDDYVVYVDNISNPTQVNGFRSGDQWYNNEGTAIEDPSILEGPNGIAPYIIDPSATASQDIESSTFRDYKPQTNFMPRIAFSFPISEEALFFAHYDVLTKRPTTGNRLNPFDYFFLDARTGTNTLNNPDLQPEKTIDYALGFQQKLTNSSSIKLELFYREMRDMVQVIAFDRAYPKTYNSYGNIDFGTVKGTTITYDLRRTGNVWLKAAYTLQFADGTGSSSTSALNLIRAGKANLRTTFPLSYDQRHAIVMTFDYRYGSGKRYNGPVSKNGGQILKNTGMNVQLRSGSGTPFSRQSNVTGSVLYSGGGQARLDGSLNGARLPWTTTVDVRFDRDIELNAGKGKRPMNMNVYFLMLNAFNTMNTIGVYRATGNPNDDGYLNEPVFQNDIENQNDPQSFREQYTMRLNNPSLYTLPRRMRIGVMLNF